MENQIPYSMTVCLLFLTMIVIPSVAGASERWPASDGDCVQWAAQKRMFLVKEVKVFGMNCDVTVDVATRRTDQSRVITATIPHRKFDSGEPERDDIVHDLLGGSKYPNVVFESNPLSVQQWRALMNGKLSSITGRLSIRNQPYAVTLALKTKQNYIYGAVQSSMSFFNVVVPNVGGGAVAKVRDYLKLNLRVQTTTLSRSASASAP